MSKNWQIPRRRFLRGLGTAVALPMLEAMVPIGQAATALGGASNAVGASPRRMAFIYVPNGANMADWTPATEGSQFELPYILEALEPHKKELLVLSGLAQDKARPNGDGAGDHARASATFLTGCQARKTQGADIKVGVSVDQMVAQRVGGQTRFSSLELGCDRAQLSGNCDSGYSCAYSFNISWRNESSPMPPETDPRLVFERLFSGPSRAESKEARAKRQLYQKSILDYVMDDARKLQSNLGSTDKRKMDEYLTAVRELEQRIEKAEMAALSLPGQERPAGIPKEYEKHIRLMYDLMVLAFQTDTTRISTFVVAHDGSNRAYPFIGVPDGHHDLSHHGNSEEKKKMIAKINRFHMDHFAYFLARLKSVREGNGTLLDQSMIVYGSGIGDGNRHNHDELPVLLAGRGGGSIETGRHLRYSKNTPMSNLYLSLMERMGVQAPRIGDSTGLLQYLG